MKDDNHNHIDLQRGPWRRIYAGFLTGDRINGVSELAECLFWRLLVHCDDYGNFDADPALLRSLIYPKRKTTPARIAALLVELADSGVNDKPPLVQFYTVGKDRYGHISGFEERQTTKNGRRAQRHPLPSTYESRGNQGKPGEGTQIQVLLDQIQIRSDSDQIPSPNGEGSRGVSKPTPTARIQWLPMQGWIGITDADKAEWAAAYPACDVDLTLAQMAAWCTANPKKARKSNWRTFVVNWLKREQDNGGSNRGSAAGGGRKAAGTRDRDWRADKAARECPEGTFRIRTG